MAKFILAAILVFVICVPVEAKVFSGQRLAKVRERVGHVLPKAKAKVGGRFSRKKTQKAASCPCGSKCQGPACGCGCK